MRQRVVPNALVVQCRLGTTNIDIYTSALSQLGVQLQVESTSKFGIKGTVEGQVAAGSELIGKVSGKLGLEATGELGSKGVPVGRNINDLQFIAQLVIESGKRLIIEDVHYLSIDQREILSYDLKALWDIGCFVTMVGVWGQANMFVRLNGELSGRVEELSIEWGPDDLRTILARGSVALGIDFSREIQNKAIIDAFGNAGLLQRLALRTLDEAKITTEQPPTFKVNNMSWYEGAAMAVADQLNGVYLKFGERVASGIRTRADATGIYAHAMAAIVAADDGMHMNGIPVEHIFTVSHSRQSRIQKSNLKLVLSKIDSLQVDKDGRGLVVTYDADKECVLNVDRQLLFYRKYLTVSWPWEELISEADKLVQ
ncbi:hypothetical protein HZU83_19135 [Sphaerotilus montanus]|uniref:Uncharacterized protein n=1 Tax=Sphaerotilus montanus TaxID=522889 RepID=A0A7Y9QVD3_9BURK|nr:hypothetical protein [Sphaerotilus montanus]NYG32061.1 hypothetical protein [Sphaerotilus montanus]NZD58795.1 hypothetical protein [Sphaerotilus montanus]